MDKLARLFTKIAREHLGIKTLQVRHRDALDFHDVSVTAVANALKAAFDAGARSTADTAEAASLLLDLIRYDLLSLKEGDAYCEITSTMYWFDDNAPDWQALADAIGREEAKNAIRERAAI